MIDYVCFKSFIFKNYSEFLFVGEQNTFFNIVRNNSVIISNNSLILHNNSCTLERFLNVLAFTAFITFQSNIINKENFSV